MEKKLLGFIGLGAMGLPMAKHLLTAGNQVLGCDLSDKRMQVWQTMGGGKGDIEDIIDSCRLIFCSLPSSEAFVDMARSKLLPRISAGSILVDLGTTTPPQTRKLADLAHSRGAELVDAPVSGGQGGAQDGTLRIFAGGSDQAFESVRPYLKLFSAPDTLFHCGPTGSGQVVKGVNQLMMGLASAAYLEALSFGVNAGIDPGIIAKAVGGEGWLRGDFLGVALKVAQGEGESVGVKFRELPYFLEEAAQSGFHLPLTRLLQEFCDAGERVVMDDNRMAPSYWHELRQSEVTRSAQP